MPDISYLLEFETRDHRGEEIYLNDEAEAWEAFRKFAEADSAELYERIRLTKIDWDEHEEKSLAMLTF